MGMLPDTYAQFGHPAGEIMWKMHQHATRLEKENDRLRAQVEALKNTIRKAPCHQDRIPCRWPCDHDASAHGRCWKQIALRGEEGK